MKNERRIGMDRGRMRRRTDERMAGSN